MALKCQNCNRELNQPGFFCSDCSSDGKKLRGGGVVEKPRVVRSMYERQQNRDPELQGEVEKIRKVIEIFAHRMERVMIHHAKNGKRGWDYHELLPKEDWKFRPFDGAMKELDEYAGNLEPNELIDAANYLMMEWIRAIKIKNKR